MNSNLPKALFVNHGASKCGVYVFGLEVFAQVATSSTFNNVYVECDGHEDLVRAITEHEPNLLILNYHPTTMPWAPLFTATACMLPTVGIMHDMTSEMADAWTWPSFDVMLTHDPDLKTTNDRFVSAPRPIPSYSPKSKPPSDGPIIVGSFGFADKSKRLDDVVRFAQESFEECIVRLHIPPNTWGDHDGVEARKIVAECEALITRPGVRVQASHDFLERDEMIEFLASNHINAMLYDADRGAGGISSSADWALASGRPFALRRGKMFRNYNGADPSIFVDDLSLAEILHNGTQPLEKYRASWSTSAVSQAYDLASTKALELTKQDWLAYTAERAVRAVDVTVTNYKAELKETLDRLDVTHQAASNLQNLVEHVRGALDVERQAKESAQASYNALRSSRPIQLALAASARASALRSKVSRLLRSGGHRADTQSSAEHNIDILVRDKFFPPSRFSRFLPQRRTIVEVGAARPDYLSISASFRKAGWKVIAIEPNPAFCEAHRAQGLDVLQYACSDENKDDVDFFVVDSLGANYMGGHVSNESFSSLGINGKFEEQFNTVRENTTTNVIKVSVRTLDTILAQHEPNLKSIDILAVDVEGWELKVMRGFSVEKYHPKVVILENNFDDTDCRTYMSGKGYDFYERLEPNDIYVRRA